MGWFFRAIAEMVVPDMFWKSPNIDFNQVTKDGYSGLMLESLLKVSFRFAVSQVLTVTQYTCTYLPSIVLWLVKLIEPEVKKLHEFMLDYYLYIILIILFIVLIAKRVVLFSIDWLLKYQQGRFKKLENEAPLTNYNCRMKWMPLLD